MVIEAGFMVSTQHTAEFSKPTKNPLFFLDIKQPFQGQRRHQGQCGDHSA